jgi:hypothetical protein
MPQIRTGHIESNGAAINIPLGFVPNYFKIINAAAADGEVAAIEWFGNEQGDAKSFFTYKHTASGFATTDTTFAYEASAGLLSDYDTKSISTSNPILVSGGKGVTVSADFSDDGDELWYIAIGSDREVDHGDINA